jgi:hypothetical protein
MTTIKDPYKVIHYQGTEGLKKMLWNELKAKEILVFGYENTNKFVGKEFADKFRKEIVKHKIKLFEIGNSADYIHKDQSFYNSVVGWEIHTIKYFNINKFQKQF